MPRKVGKYSTHTLRERESTVGVRVRREDQGVRAKGVDRIELDRIGLDWIGEGDGRVSLDQSKVTQTLATHRPIRITSGNTETPILYWISSKTQKSRKDAETRWYVSRGIGRVMRSP